MIVLLLAIVAGTSWSALGSLVRDHPNDVHQNVLTNKGWLDRLHGWLDSAYVEASSGNEAGFADLPSSYMENPGLLQTYNAVRILSHTNVSINDSVSIIEWLESLRLPTGEYRDTNFGLSPLSDTYWAVTTQAVLGKHFDDTDDLIVFLRSLRRDDRLFDENPDNENDLPYWEDTRRVVELLSILSSPAARELLGETKGPLAQEVERRITEHSREAADAPLSPMALAQISSLLRIDPTYGGQSLVDLLLKSLRIALSTPSTDPLAFIYVQNVVDTLDLADPQALDSMLGELQQYVSTKVVPYLNKDEEQNYSPAQWFPGATDVALNLATRVGREVHLIKLEKHLAQARLEGGWRVPVMISPSVQTTYAATHIARVIGYRSFESSRVALYLTAALNTRRDAPQDLFNAHYALRGLRNINRVPEPAVIDNLRRMATETVEAVTANPNRERYALYWYSMLASELNWRIPDAIQERILAVLNEDEPSFGTSVRAIQRYVVLQEAVGANVVTDDHIEQQLMRYLGPDGGYTASSRSNSSDVEATFLAIDALTRIGRLKKVDAARIEAFLASCRREFGYGNEAGSATEEKAFTNLETTGLAFEILGAVGVDLTVDPSGMVWLPWLSRLAFDHL